MTRTQAWLASARVANLPTVWSTVIVASLISGALLQAPPTPSSATLGQVPKEVLDSLLFTTPGFWIATIIACIAYSALYCGGCLLGDAWDADWDARQKPDRPIPNGILSKNEVFLIGWACIADCVICLGLIPAFTGHVFSWITIISQLLLLASVIAYARIHKALPPAGLALMTACRFFLVMAATAPALAVGYRFKTEDGLGLFLGLGHATAMAIYTVGIVLVARTESTPEALSARRTKLALMILLPIGLLVGRFLFFGEIDLAISLTVITIACALPFVGSLLIGARHLSPWRLNKPAFVSAALASFPLVDLVAISILATSFSWVVSIPLACFILAKILQRITPAT